MTQTINGTKYETMEGGDIILVSERIEIHPSGPTRFSVVRDGAVYGTYPRIEDAEKIAKQLA